MSVYELAYGLVCELERRFERGQFLRDAGGQIIDDLPGLLLAIEAGLWPGGQDAA